MRDLQPSLVGRERELRALEELVRGARRGGRVAVLEGEAGIGKTRLVQAALERARAAGMSVLVARAEELDAHRPFAAIADALPDRRRRERLEAQLRDWQLGPDVAGERQFQVAEIVLELLEELGARGPAVLAIEDLHWADPGTVGVLARVARELDRLPVTALLTARPQPRRHELERLLALLDADGAAMLRLGPLDERSSAALLEGLAGAPPGPELVEQARRAGGNPLFLTELFGAMEADGAVVRRGGRAEIAATGPAPSLPLTILHRLSFLPPDVLELLGLASVLGATFTAADLALVAGRPVAGLVPGLRAAREAGFLGEHGDRLAFRHELIRDALYEDMPLSVRRGLHAELARSLAAAGEPTERVAEHLVRGAAPGDARAVGALADAARDVVGRSPAAAVTLYRQAIALAADPEAARTALLPDLAEAMVAAGQLGEGEQACREALALGLDPARSGRLHLLLVFLLARRSRMTEALELARAGAALAGADAADRARLQGWVALAGVFVGLVEPAVRDARAVLETADDALARALAANTLAMAADAGGRFAEAAELMEPGVRWAETSGSRDAHEMRPHMIMTLMLARLDRLDDARANVERGRRGAETLGLADALPVFHYQAAFVAFLQGRLEDALAELAAHAQLAELTQIGWHLSSESLRALIALHRDELLAAEEHVAAAEREAAAGAPPFGTDLMVLARALLLEADGRADAAVDALAGTFDAMAAAGAATFLPALGPEMARLAVATAAPQRAAGVVAPLERIAAQNPGVRSLAAGPLRVRGLLDGDGEALAAAADLLYESGRVLEGARAAEDAAAAGHSPRERLERARDVYAAAGAVRDTARAERSLRALGVRRGVSGPRRRPATGWEALTDTELRVVRLVAERLTNPEIAERMFISRRTVQTHVSHALAKLGVATRRDLAAEAARRAGWRLRIERPGEQAQQSEPALEPVSRPTVDGDGA